MQRNNTIPLDHSRIQLSATIRCLCCEPQLPNPKAPLCITEPAPSVQVPILPAAAAAAAEEEEEEEEEEDAAAAAEAAALSMCDDGQPTTPHSKKRTETKSRSNKKNRSLLH